MLRLTTNLRCLQLTAENLSKNTNLQTVRWRRKPLWMPTAKTKMFRIPQRPVLPIEEQEELKRLFNHYRTQMKSIKKYLINTYSTDLQETVDEAKHLQDFEEDFAKCNEINNQWNNENKGQRETRVQKQIESEIEEAKQRLATRQEVLKGKLEEAEEIVRQQKLLADTFITRENIDEALEKAVATQVDYNYAVDRDGNKIMGRETIPEKVEEKISLKQ